MNEDDRWTHAVHRLAVLTRDGKINWQTKEKLSFTNTFGRRDEFGIPYFALYGGKTIALYEIEVTDMDDNENYFQRREVCVEFVKNDGTMEMEWPLNRGGNASARDLINVVRHKMSGADEFLDKLLGDSPNPQK